MGTEFFIAIGVSCRTIRPCHTAAILSRETKRALFTTPNLAVETMGVRLGVVKQRFFGLPGQYGRRVTRANYTTKFQWSALQIG